MINKPFELGLTLQGIVLPTEKPIIDFWIEPLKKFVPALLDTGATQYSIENELALALNLEKRENVRVAYLALNEVAEVSVYSMEFRLAGMMDYRITENFYSIPFNFMYKIIIGTDFLKRCKSFHIDYINKTWTIEL